MKCDVSGAAYREQLKRQKEREANDKRTPEQKKKDAEYAIKLFALASVISATQDPFEKF